MKLVTERQKEVLEVVISQTIEQQRIMTIRDVANYFKITTKAASDNITSLINKGHIHPLNNKAGVYPIGIEIVRRKVKASEL